MALTTGVKNAMARGAVHSTCACGFPLPKYPGRYPKVCPNCGEPRTKDESVEEDAAPHEILVGASVRVDGGVEGVVVEIDEDVAFVELPDGTLSEVSLEEEGRWGEW